MAEDCANPLLLGWLKEWMDEAQERNSKGYTVYKKAYQSMKACPLTFEHPSQAQQLNGLGPKLCDRLTDKLKAYCTQNGLPPPEKPVAQSKRRPQTGDEESLAQPPRKARKVQLYVPKLRSGAYALIMALADLDLDGKQALSKADLIEKAQPLCDASFSVPSDPTKFYTAWQSMKTLESKELICTKGHPMKRYYLSDEGWEVAQRMKAAEGGTTSLSASKSRKKQLGVELSVPPTQATKSGTVIDLESDSDTNEGPDNSHRLSNIAFDNNRALNTRQAGTIHMSSEPITLQPGSFEVCLVLDNREVRTKNDRDYLARELRKLDVIPDIRALPLGDVLWVAKVKDQHQANFKASNPGDEEEGSTEVVLEHVIERKRLDDLIGSIKDGRFHEQKFRLRKSGMRYVTYLIEDYSISAERSEKYGEAVESAIAGMQVVNDIFVKQTTKIDNTIQYLARMTKLLKETYESRTIHVLPSQTLNVAKYLSSLDQSRQQEPEKAFCITFSAFSSICDKSDTMTLRDVYLKMLMCTRGVTGDKAVEIQKLWPTPQALIEAYDNLGADAKRKECMISDKLTNTIPRKKVAKALSAKIAEVWAG